jgi:hypothetical protein
MSFCWALSNLTKYKYVFNYVLVRWKSDDKETTWKGPVNAIVTLEQHKTFMDQILVPPKE